MGKATAELQSSELAFWDDFQRKKTGGDWLGNVSNKFSEMRWLAPKFATHQKIFAAAQSALELGGGEGWASCALKRLFPNLHVTASDISEAAISGIPEWERIFASRVDASFSCKSYSVPLPAQSLDVIFCFQAAHHFVLQAETLREAARLLKAGGVCMYLHEPSCRRYIYPLAKWRVNRKRPECPEDLLVIQNMHKLAAETGFTLTVAYSPATVNRGVVEGIYYKALSSLPFLCPWLPCTADFLFQKQ